MKSQREIIQDVFQKIWTLTTERIEIDEIGLQLIQELYPAISDLEANDLWEKIRKKVIKFLQKKIEDCKNRKVLPRYVFSRNFSTLLVRYDRFVQNKDSEEREKIRLAILHRNDIQNAFFHLHWRQFEKLCAYLLKCLGCKFAWITPKIKEGGIDICGIAEPNSLIFSKGIVKAKIGIIGQVKNWQRKIDEPHIDEFRTKFNDFLKGDHKIIPKLPREFLECTQFYALMMVSSSFTSDAIAAAQKGEIKILLYDGEQIAENLITLHDFQVVKGWFIKHNGKEVFHGKNFISWLKNIKINEI